MKKEEYYYYLINKIVEKNSIQKLKRYKISDKERCFCSACGKWFKLGVGIFHKHHVLLKSKNGTDRNINMLLLCANCHGIIHYFIKKYNGRTRVYNLFRNKHYKGTIRQGKEIYFGVAHDNSYKLLRSDIESFMGNDFIEYFKGSFCKDKDIINIKESFIDLVALIVRTSLIDNKYNFSKHSNIIRS